jgi:hypothetical protein
MISTRLHGLIDYTVAALFGTLAASHTVPPRVRGVLGTASAYHVSYAAMTDYEAGLQPRLTMRQHLVLDAVGGAALCGAGLLMRREHPAMRALLIAAGLSELAVVALSSSTPQSGPGQHLHSDGPTYPPLDTPKRIAEDLYIVDSELPGAMGAVLPARMTVVRLPGGDLLLHSPTRFTPALQTELEQLGRIRHLVAPNVAHWTFLNEWQRACPDVVTWAAPGLRKRSQVRKSGVRLDHDLAAIAPDEWGGAIALATMPGGFGFREIALFHRPTRTLLLTDLVVNLEARKVPAAIRPFARLLGITAPDGMPPAYLRAVINVQRPAAVAAAERLLAMDPQRVIFAHGRWFEQDGAALLRRSLRWVLA